MTKVIRGYQTIPFDTQDIVNGKIHNFFTPYDNLGKDNPMSGVYVQAFNEAFGTNDRAVLCS